MSLAFDDELERAIEFQTATLTSIEAEDPIGSVEEHARLLHLQQRDAEAAGFTTADIEQSIARGAERAAQEQSPRERLVAGDPGSGHHTVALRLGFLPNPK